MYHLPIFTKSREDIIGAFNKNFFVIDGVRENIWNLNTLNGQF